MSTSAATSLPSSRRRAARASLVSGPTTRRRASTISSSVNPAATAADVTSAERASAARACVLARERERDDQHADDLALDVVHGSERDHAIGLRGAARPTGGTWVAVSARPRASSDMRRVMCPASSTDQTATYSTSSLRPSVTNVACRSAGSSKITAGAQESAKSRVTALGAQFLRTQQTLALRALELDGDAGRHQRDQRQRRAGQLERDGRDPGKPHPAHRPGVLSEASGGAITGGGRGDGGREAGCMRRGPIQLRRVWKKS